MNIMNRWAGGELEDFPHHFNGDGRDDLMCRNIDSGHTWIDCANSSGQFGGTDWNGASDFCVGGNLYIGDGRSELICHTSAGISLDFAGSSGPFGGADWFRAAGWCVGDNQYLRLGDFDGDGLVDLLCHNAATGTLSIDYADYNLRYQGTDWTRADAFCGGRDDRSFFVGDFNGDGHDDLLCVDRDTGDLYIGYWTASQIFAGADWHDTGSCVDDYVDNRYFIYSRRVGRLILCHTPYFGGDLQIDCADRFGELNGFDWSRDANGCGSDRQRLC